MMKEPVVYVKCLAYNHAPYIRHCLDGFVMQETDFPFRVIVHDDASTDGTAEIVKEYKEKYPELFHVILQEENQYSKGINIAPVYINPLLKGKYVALCEGDDCWIRPDKLQKQYDYMESHPECSICVHNAIKKIEGTGEEQLMPGQPCDKDYSIDEVIEDGAGLFATNSNFIRTEYYLNRPECFLCKGVGDYQTVMYAAMNGTCHYFADVMSQYNYATRNSWTERVYNNREARINHFDDMIRMLRRVDRYYKYKYHEPITKKVNQLKEHIFFVLDEPVSLTIKERKKLAGHIIRHAAVKSRIRAAEICSQYKPFKRTGHKSEKK